MKILNEKVDIDKLRTIETETFFEDMIKAVVDTEQEEYDSLINPPRNREAGFPRAGRTVADPVARQKIEEAVHKWIEM